MNIPKYSIRKKFLIILLFNTIFPLSLAMIITYSYSRNHFNHEILCYNENLMYQLAGNVNHHLSNISNSIYSPYSNQTMYAFLTQNDTATYSDYSTISAFMYSIASASNDISEITLESSLKAQKYIYQNTKLKITESNKTEESPEHTTLSIVPTHKTASGIDVFTLTLFMKNVPQNESMGTLSIDVSLNTLDIFCSQTIDDTNEHLSIIDINTRTVIYSTDSERIGNPVNQKLKDILLKIKDSSSYLSFGSQIYFYETIDVFDTPWIIIKEIPSSDLYKDIEYLQSIYLPTYFLFLMISVLMTWHISSHFTAPIVRLTRQMNNIRYGEPYKPISLKQEDEIGILYDSFNSMIETINNLMIQEYELRLSTKNAQLRMLQAQLNPHFLNNSLQSLGTLALQKQSPEIYSLITSLALMMNYAMDIQNPLIPLEREFEYTKNYLIFQHQRFGDKLHYELNLEPDTANLVVPKMILQPIVENYFKHGFIKRPEGYIVKASSKTVNGLLIITVENNGSSLSDEQLTLLKNDIEQADILDNNEHSFGIGLINIQTRLNLYYNYHAHIAIENLNPYGIRIQINLSLKEGPNENIDY